MTGAQFGWTLLKIVIMVGFLFNTGAVLTWLDRRQSAMIQDRIGPNRAVIKVLGIEFRLGGLLHTAADGIKFFFKEDFIPPNADKVLFALAPILAMMPVLALVAVIPFGDTVAIQYLWHHGKTDALLDVFFPAVPRFGAPVPGVGPVELIVAPLNVGILFVFALAGQGIVGAAIAGWSSDNKFSLMGALRAASQMVSYEVTMGLSLVGAMMLYGTVRLDDMVRWQGENAWGIFVQPVAFILFFVAAVAESKRIPFDLPEAESELVSGYFTEYSGMKFGMFYFAEYMEICTSSMLLVTIFLGGWQLPFMHRDGISIDFGYAHVWSALMPHLWVTVFQVATFFGKTLMVCWLQAFVRWSLPRFRYDQLMKLGWRVLLPCSLANILLTGVGVLSTDHFSESAKGGLKVAADVSQGLVFAAIVAFVVALVAGFIRPQKHARWMAGTSARFAQAKGGTKATPMQA
jgi:NADH-quinone oxidoreductase subunit H